MNRKLQKMLTGRRRRKARSTRFTPRLEALEDRRMMATFSQVSTQLNLDLDKADTNLSIVARTASSNSVPLEDVTTPTDPITHTFSGSFTPEEGPRNAIDNLLNSKYFNKYRVDSDIIVTPVQGSTIVAGLRFATANDAVERDPASYKLEGAASPAGPFTVISQGILALPDTRNTLGAIVSFTNTTAYKSYRLTFPTLKNVSAADGMQIGEIELLGVPGTSLANYDMALTLNNGDTWKGTDTADFKGAGTNTLTVSPAGIAMLTAGVKVTDSAAATSVTFADSKSANYKTSVDVKLDHSAAGPVIFEGTSTFLGNASLTAAS
ncbi:MAG: hypothetical protein HYV60_24710, partial [Planctomycetia bacterium]|nr:hypothetical protein [Planctomycetia bacterium]